MLTWFVNHFRRRDGQTLLAFLVCAILNVLAVERIDDRIHSRGFISDKTVVHLDIVGLALLGVTLLALWLRSPRNVSPRAACICGLLPGVIMLVYMLV